MIRDAWTEAVIIRADRVLIDEIRPLLPRFDVAGMAVFRWHRDSMLTACRRLIDQRADVRSLRRGLELVRSSASQLTEELHCVRGVPSWSDRESLNGADPSEVSIQLRHLESIARERIGALRGIVEDAGSRYDGHLVQAAVKPDIERLKVASRGPVVAFVNEEITHRKVSIADATSTLGYSDVDEFLNIVIDIAERWGITLDGVQREFRPPTLTGTTPLQLALEKFDMRVWLQAVGEAHEAVGPDGTAEEYRAARDRLRIRFDTD